MPVKILITDLFPRARSTALYLYVQIKYMSAEGRIESYGVKKREYKMGDGFVFKESK